MFYCGEKTSHQHTTILEAKSCPRWRTLFGYVAPTPPPATMPIAGPLGRATWNQLRYVDTLHGDRALATSMTVAECSRYIDQLKAVKQSAAPVYERSIPQTQDPRLPMIDQLLDVVPDGYYAVRTEGQPYKFIRFSRPKKGQYANCLKFQEHLGSWDGGRYEETAVRWRSGSWSIYKPGYVDLIMLIIADHQGAALTYAAELKRCCRCNADLTLERSRWYGIGPECEGYWPWIIEHVEDRKGRYRAGVSD